MLMCDKHHRIIDREDVEGHPVEKLIEMKKNHEMRIEMVTSIDEERKTMFYYMGQISGAQFTYSLGENNSSYVA